MINLDLREDIASYLDTHKAQDDTMQQTYGLTQGNIVLVLGGSRYVSEPMVDEVAPILETDAPRHWRMMLLPKGASGLSVAEFGIREPGTDETMVSLSQELKVNSDIRISYDYSEEVRKLFAGIGSDVISLVAESGDVIFSGIERRLRRSTGPKGNHRITDWSQLVYSKELLRTTDIARETVIYLRNKRRNIPNFIHRCALEENRLVAARAMALSALAQTIEL